MDSIYRVVFDEYIADLHRQGRRPRGINNVSCRLKRFFDYLSEQELTFARVRVNEAQGYQGWLKEYGSRTGVTYRNASIKTYLTAVVSFFDFLTATKRVYSNPFREIRRVQPEKTLPKNLPKEKRLHLFLQELSAFEREPNLTARITRFRVWIVAELMYATGLRIAEVADLTPADIDFERGLVHVHAGKMGIDRVCYLHDYAARLVRVYLDEFRELTFNSWNRENGHLLFGTKWSNFEKTVNKVLKRISLDMGHPPFTSHMFRHCLGFHLLRSGCDVRYIQAILGHKLLRNTEVYTQVDKDDLQEVFDRCHPRTYRQEGVDDQT
jgi:site-specific recombinase XerD